MMINILIAVLIIIVGALTVAICFNTIVYSVQSAKSGEWENACILAFFGMLILLGIAILIAAWVTSPAPIKP